MALVSTIGTVRKFLTAALRVKLEYEPHRHIVSPYRAPFTLFSGGKLIGENEMGKDTVLKEVKPLISSRQVNELKIRNQDFGVLPYQFTAGAGSAVIPGTPFTLVFNNTDGVKVNDILKSIITGETYFVSVKAGTTLTLNVQAGAGAAITAGDRFIKTANANPDFWTFGTGVSIEPEEYYNLIQVMSHEVGIGLIAMQQEIHPKGDGREEDRMTTLEHQTVSREVVAIDGVRAATTQGSDTVYTSDGLRSMAEVVVDVGGSLGYEGFRKDVETRVAKPGPETRWMTNTGVKANLAMWNMEKVRTTQDENAFGTNIDRVQGLYEHAVHETEPMENYPGEAVLFKKENISRCYLGALDSLFLKGVHASNTAGEVDAYVVGEAYQRTDEDALTRLVNWNG